LNETNIDIAFRIAKTQGRPALLTYIVAGDKNKKMTVSILKSINSHVDICEVGIPHNTSVADGKQIQNSIYRALKGKIKLNDVFEIVKEYKKDLYSKPVILMGYYNMVLQYGEKNFLKKCIEIDVDGIILVDLPFPENKVFAEQCEKNGITFVQLLAPTTSNKRLKEIIKNSHSMLYYISMLSTTGGKLKVSSKQILKNYFRIKKIDERKNIVIGFGITNKNIKSLKKADGVVVGSEICKEITSSIERGKNPVIRVNKIVKSLKDKIE